MKITSKVVIHSSHCLDVNTHFFTKLLIYKTKFINLIHIHTISFVYDMCNSKVNLLVIIKQETSYKLNVLRASHEEFFVLFIQVLLSSISDLSSHPNSLSAYSPLKWVHLTTKKKGKKDH